VLHLNQTGVDVLIKRFNCNSKTAYWENYDLVIWNKDHSGYTNIKGLYRNNAWGIAERVSVSTKGTWVLPRKYVKYFR
jgi:hypothetical protein